MSSTFGNAVTWANDRSKKTTIADRNPYLFWIVLAAIVGTVLVIWLIIYFMTKTKESKSNNSITTNSGENSEPSSLESMRKSEYHDKEAYLAEYAHS